MTVFKTETVMPCSCSPYTIRICYIFDKFFSCVFHFESNMFIVVFKKQKSRKISSTINYVINLMQSVFPLFLTVLEV